MGMRMMRSLPAAAVLAASGLLLAGCGAGGQAPAPTSEAPNSSALASFDPCTALTPEELQSLGVDPSEKEPVDEGMGDVGCDFTGEEIILSITKAEQDDLASWKARSDNFDRLDPNTVAGREGLVGVTKGSTGKGVCRQIVGAGGSSVTTQVTFVDPNTGKTADPCAEATKAAEVLVPKLPQ